MLVVTQAAHSVSQGRERGKKEQEGDSKGWHWLFITPAAHT